MTARFLAEDFRKLMDQLDVIHEIDAPLQEETPDEKDIEDLMKSDRDKNISSSDINDIESLIEFLDQFSELDTWRNHTAMYDDAFYNDLPLDILEQVTGLSRDDLLRIDDQTSAYEGNIIINDNAASIFGST